MRAGMVPSHRRARQLVHCREGRESRRCEAGWVAEAAGAVPHVSGRIGKRARATRAIRVWLNVKDDIVRVSGNTRHSADHRSELVEPQRVRVRQATM